MFRFRLDIAGEIQMDRGIARFADGVTDYRPIWPMIADEFYAEERAQFKSEGGEGGEKWAPLSKGYADWKAVHYPGKEYALEIEEGGEKTGLAAEDMSKLRYVGAQLGVSYGTLTGLLTKFAATIDKARESGSQQAEVFQRMGISQREVEAGSKDMLPLLMRVSDAFRDQMTAVERAAIARDLFGRGGAELIEVLKRGSGAIREMAQEAERLGLVFSEDDVTAAKELQVEMNYLRATSEALWLSIGRWALPKVVNMVGGLEALAGGIKFAWGGRGGTNPVEQFLTGFDVTARAAAERIAKQIKAGLATGAGMEPPGSEEAKAATQDFRGLSSILDQVRLRMASTEGEEAKVTEGTRQLRDSVSQAAAEMAKLRAEGKLTPETLAREMAALDELSPAITKWMDAQLAEMREKRREAIEAAAAMQAELTKMQPGSPAQAHAAWDAEMDQRLAAYEKAKILTEENERLLAQIREEGHRKIEAEQGESFVRQLAVLQRDLAEMVTAHFTARERVDWIYEEDLQRFSESEEAKTLALATSEAQREAIRQQYEMNRQAAYDRHASELLALKRSEGWEGVFGGAFAEMIRGNEQLLRDWTFSTEQGGMIVQVAMAGLSQSAQKAFGQFASGMGQNIAQSIVYSKSIGEAMRNAVASTLAGLAAGKSGGEAAGGGAATGAGGGGGAGSEAGGGGTRVAIYVSGNIVGRAGKECGFQWVQLLL